MTTTLIDLSSLHAVESLFHGGNCDPWASKLAGDLIDLAIYSDQVRYPLPTSTGIAELRTGPTLVLQLASRDSSLFVPQHYSTDTPLTVADEHLENCLDQFAGWCRGNPTRVRQWIALHQESWISSWHTEHVQHHYVFDLNNIMGREDIRHRANAAGLTLEGFLYAFDIVLRYPMYGEIAGEGCAYLSHPIRDAIIHPSLEQEPATKPVGPISFANTFAVLAPQLNHDEYTGLIHELRGVVRDMGIHRLKSGQVEKAVVRELASKVALPPKLRHTERRLALAAGFIGGLGAFPFVGPVGPILGAAVSIAQCYWSGNLPRGTSRVRWLRWALSWDVESQAQG